MNTTTTYTVTLPDGTEQKMSHDPKVYQAGTHAWLTEDQVAFTLVGLSVLLSTGQVEPVVGTGPDQGKGAFVVVDPNTGQPTPYAVYVFHPDGTAETVLPVNVAELQAHVMHGTDGNPHGDQPESVPTGSLSEPVPTAALGDYL